MFELSDIQKKLREIIKEIISSPELVDNIGPYDELTSIGINSISFVKIMVAIEQEYGIEVDDDDLDINKFKNLDGLVNYISKT